MSKKKTVDTENLKNFKVKRLVHLIFNADKFHKEDIEEQLKIIDLDLERKNELSKRPFVDCIERYQIDQYVSAREVDQIMHRFSSQFEVWADYGLRAHLPERSVLTLEYDGIDRFGSIDFSIGLKTFGDN